MVPTNELRCIGGSKLKTNMIKYRLDKVINVNLNKDEYSLEIVNDIINNGNITTTVTVSVEVENFNNESCKYEFLAKCILATDRDGSKPPCRCDLIDYNITASISTIFYRTEEPSSNGEIPPIMDRLRSLSFVNHILVNENNEYMTLENEDHKNIIRDLYDPENILLAYVNNYGYTYTMDIILRASSNRKGLSA